ncbi:MAG: LysR family transcriptional regulator [Gammaproteobacteria bacterium]|nr:LysR family transcriptional regulator [Gammaproteobacteria bacterium]
MHVTIRQLRVFESVARNLSYTGAAAELHLTQPAVSMQIKQLEENVGLPLFEQVGRRTHPTEAGRELHATCREIFGALERYAMTVSELKGLKRGTLRLGVITTAEYFAPRVLGPFCQAHPGIDVSLEVTNREGLLERLGNNVDDLYIFGQPPEGLEVEAIAFLENPLVVLAARDHPLAGRRRIPLSRLAEEPFLTREPGSGTRLATERLFTEHGLRPKVRMELGSNEAIKHAVAGGLGVSVLSRHTLALEGETNPITILDVEEFPIRRHWYVVYPRGKKPSVVARAFLEYLQGEGQRRAAGAGRA